jgi:tetratricopeptide (TPR) repeat protein
MLDAWNEERAAEGGMTASAPVVKQGPECTRSTRPVRSTAAGLMLAAALVPVRGARADLPKEITCSAPAAARQFQVGLASLYGGRWTQAAREFRAGLRQDPDCAMLHWGLSRAVARGIDVEEERAEADLAMAHADRADERERLLITAWNDAAKAATLPDTQRSQALARARAALDGAIALYPDEAEFWLLRGELAENPLRAAPFYLAALRLQPEHPFGRHWQPVVPPPPDLTPAPTQPVAVLSQAPKLFDGLGKLSYPITTRSPQAQAYFEQGLRCYHAYVTPGYVANGAAVSFQHAANLDPDCAMAYWGLSLCQSSSMSCLDAANRALELAQRHGTDRERRMAAARILQLSGPLAYETFLDALDGAIAAYPDDVELWIWRGKAWGEFAGGNPTYLAGGRPGGLPYELAAHRLQPEHPAPNHELIHDFEEIDRPALGWPFTEGFRRSAPNMPHANHMQGHLAMRLGLWQEAVDCTRTSRRRSLEGYPELDPSHHITTMLIALMRQGHFQEAEAEPKAYRNGLDWARLLQLKADAPALAEWAQHRLESKSPEGTYMSAVVRLDRGDTAGAQPLLAAVEAQGKQNTGNFYRYAEVKGRYLVQTGQADEGLKLLREAAGKAVNDSGLHAWGGGSYVLEVWGEAALRAHQLDEAEEAFLEALAHEHGSVIGALGLQVVCEQRGNPSMARHYAERAAAIWKDADPGALDRQLQRLRRLVR